MNLFGYQRLVVNLDSGALLHLLGFFTVKATDFLIGDLNIEVSLFADDNDICP